MTSREAVLRNASELAHFDADFDMSVVYRLQNSMHSSVDVLATYGLGRVHAWLWPLIKDLSTDDEVQIGPFRIVGAEQEVATNREQSKQAFYVHAEDLRWKLAWFDADGPQSSFAVGVDPEGFFSVAYCEFGDKVGGPVAGGVSGRGSEIRQLFNFLVLAGEAMPSSALEIDGSVLRRPWEFEDIHELVAFDGRLGATFGAEMHDLAEQRASKLLCDIAANNAIKLVGELTANGLVYGKSFLRCKDTTVFAVETPDQSRIAFYSERFPGGEWDRYLSWCDMKSDGSVSQYHSYLLPPEKQVSGAISDFVDGSIRPSVTHDYSDGVTSFPDTVNGYTMLASATIFLHHDAYLLSHLQEDDWQRSEHFDDLDYRDGKVAPTIG
jgi:hypothetical protein